MKEMKNRIFALAFTLALAPAAALTLVGCESDDQGASPAAAALTAEQVIDRHHQAIGGEARWKSLQTLEMHGAVARDGETHEFHAYRARPNKLRKEGMYEGKPFVKVFDGVRGYKRSGDGEFEPIPEEHAAKMAAYAEFDDPLLDHQRRGTKVALVGVEEVPGGSAYHLEVTLAGGDVEHRYLDRTTFLDVMRRSTYKDKDGQEKTSVSTFSDWREVDGIKINFAAETEHDGKKSVMTMKEVKVDQPIEAAIFSAAPRVTAAWP